MYVSGYFGENLLGIQQEKWLPFVKVQIVELNGEDDPKIKCTDLVALIDTGAHQSLIDLSLSIKLGYPRTRDNDIVMLGQTSRTFAHNVVFGFEGFPHVYQVETPVYDFHGANQKFDCLLGWDILRHFTIILGRENNSVTLVHKSKQFYISDTPPPRH